MTMEDSSSLDEPDYPSSCNQSPVSNTESVNTSQDLILVEYFFTEGFVPSYNPPITDPLGRILIQIAPIPTMSSNIPTPSIPLVTNDRGILWTTLDHPHFPNRHSVLYH